MVNNQEKFLIDANSLMTPFRRYYAFDLVPTYWEKLSEYLSSGHIILLDMIKNEIDKGEDELTDWVNAEQDVQICNHVTEKIVGKYQQVLQYVKDCGLYKDTAFQIWAPGDVADPWIIATAATHGYTIVTEEVSSGGLSKKTPNKVAKIPDVAKAFNVDAINVFEMMRRLGIVI